MQKMQEMEQAGGPQGLPTDRKTLNMLMALHPGLNSSMNNHQQLVGRGPLTGSAQAALALTNYNLLMRQNSMNSTHNMSLQQEASSPFSTSSQTPTTPGPSGILPGTLQNSPVSGFSSGQASQRQQLQLHSPSGNGLLQQNQSLHSQGSQALHQQMIQQLLQDMSNKNNGTAVTQQSLSVQNQGGNMSRDDLGFRSSAAGNGPGNVVGHPPGRSSSFNAALNGEPPAPPGNIRFSEKASDLRQNLHSSDELVPDVAEEFTENGFFNSDIDDMNFDWKA